MEKISGKEIVKNMEYLVKLLHQEWERSGRTKAQVSINISGREAVWAKLAEAVQDKQKQLEAGEMPFKKNMALSKESFILLRLAKKIKKAGDRAERREDSVSFTVEMDREEYRMFATLINVQEE